MAILEKFSKQPLDVQDYDVSYVEWLDSLSDTAVSCAVVVEPGITLDAFGLSAGVVKVWLSGGTTGASYKVTTTVTTTGGRVKEAEIVIKVKES